MRVHAVADDDDGTGAALRHPGAQVDADAAAAEILLDHRLAPLFDPAAAAMLRRTPIVAAVTKFRYDGQCQSIGRERQT